MKLTDILGPRARFVIYLVWLSASIAASAVQVWCQATNTAQPTWLDGATAVLVYLGTATGVLALANVNERKAVPVAENVSAHELDAAKDVPGRHVFEPNRTDETPQRRLD